MSETTINIPLLRKAVEWAEAEAALPVAQSAWFQPGVVTPGEQIGRSCGTAYCIAGYIAMIETGEVRPGIEAVSIAFDALGTEDVGGLFWADNTIEQVREYAEALAGERL